MIQIANPASNPCRPRAQSEAKGTGDPVFIKIDSRYLLRRFGNDRK